MSCLLVSVLVVVKVLELGWVKIWLVVVIGDKVVVDIVVVVLLDILDVVVVVLVIVWVVVFIGDLDFVVDFVEIC